MKPYHLTLVFLLAAGMAASAQTIRLVDNTPNKPAGTYVYSTVQAAIDSAVAGDIIHVKPSETSYGSITINKPLSIFGIGFNPQKDIPKISVLDDVYFNAGSSGSRISGFNINEIHLGYEVASYTIKDILIDNNEVDFIILSTTCCTKRSVDNVLIRNNIIGTDNVCCYVINLSNGSYNSISNVVITNNIIKPYGSTSYAAMSGSALLIKNNLFYGDGSYSFESFGTITNSTISNNIFFGSTPEADYTSESNVFNNNLSSGTANDSLPSPGKLNGTLGSGRGNTGSGNLQSVAPAMTNIAIGTTWSFTFDITPQSGSPLINAGTDGTNIGPTGGTTPWDNSGEVLPIIKTIIANDVVKQGDNLNVEVKAEGNN